MVDPNDSGPTVEQRLRAIGEAIEAALPDQQFAVFVFPPGDGKSHLRLASNCPGDALVKVLREYLANARLAAAAHSAQPGRVAAEAWESYARERLPKRIGEIERRGQRQAFHAGARGLLRNIVVMLEGSANETEAEGTRIEESHMNSIAAELERFERENGGEAS